MAVTALVESRLSAARASVVAAHGLSSLCGMWDLPRSRIKPGSPALAGRFLSTVLLRKFGFRNSDH